MLRSRFRRITWYFFRVLLGLIWWELFLPRIGFRSFVKRTRSDRLRRIAIRFRMMAIQMGGVLIKVGQFLSSRVDVIPPEIIHELEGLQDEVAAEQFDHIRQIAETELEATLGEKFYSFNPVALASASLGQVHAAKLIGSPSRSKKNSKDLVDVVVKIQRPNIEKIISIDLIALQRVGKWLNLYKPISRRANISALLAEFSRTLYEEIDYLAEGRNAESFSANFKDEIGILVPQVVWTHTTRRVLTLEDVKGIKITDYDQITQAGIDRADVAHRLILTYLKQIFEDGFFHADPHPGNLFVQLAPEGDLDSNGKPRWQLTFVDFGMVGHISPQAKEGMSDMLIGIVTRDTDRVLMSFKKLGFLLPGADLELIKKAENEVFDRFWGKSMRELQLTEMNEMLAFAYQFRDLLYELPFQIPQDLIYIGRAVGILSGMCTGLNPDFNVWNALSPYAKKMLADEGLLTWEKLKEEMSKYARKLLTLPSRIDSLLETLEKGELVAHDPQLTRRVEKLESTTKQVSASIIFSIFMFSAVVSYLTGHMWLSVFLVLCTGVSFLGVIRKRL